VTLKSFFNWKFYVSFYEDLPAAGINTEDSAWNHWINHGRNEGRLSKENMINKFYNIIKPKGIFYNSKKALCSIWESGKMCYDALSISSNYILDYTEDCEFLMNYDFLIYNHHYNVNNWITKEMIDKFNKISFCIVTEVGLYENPIDMSPIFFDHYIVLDPTIQNTSKIHPFCRPLENIQIDKLIPNDIPKIGSFGFATSGKDWDKIVECVHNEFEYAEINFNIPKGTHVPDHIHYSLIEDIKIKCNNIITKQGIKLNITHDILSKKEIVDFCNSNTINCFFYNRGQTFRNGLSAVVDQAIV
jgi:hypothetical protein